MPHVRFVDNHHFIFTAGSRLAAQLGMPISTDGMLALLHKGNLSTASTPRILGVDEWAWRRGWRYGTILCDLEKHCPIDLLPDCSRERVAAWLKTIPVSKSSAVIVLIIMPKQPKHVFPMRFRWQTGGVHFKVLPSPVANRSRKGFSISSLLPTPFLSYSHTNLSPPPRRNSNPETPQPTHGKSYPPDAHSTPPQKPFAPWASP